MAANVKRLVIVGQGAAGLSAAVSAAERAARAQVPIEVTLLEKAKEDAAGGNSRWSPSYMRMAAPDRIAPDFEADMQRASGGKADKAYFRRLAERAPATMQWLEAHGVRFDTPTYYLSVGPPRIQPVGGGAALIGQLLKAACRAGVTIRYQASAARLIVEGGIVRGVEVDGDSRINSDAVVLASGGFQGNPDMMAEFFGADARTMAMISPGSSFNTGDGIRLAIAAGATPSGDWSGMHAEPVDPRSRKPAPVVLVYPYGIVVDKNGNRFFDEAAGLVHETWEAFARDIHLNRPGAIAYAILDAQLRSIAGFERAIRSDVPPFETETIEELARMIEVPPEALRRTIEAFNAAATGDVIRFDATRCDGLAAAPGLRPPKSNWARPIEKPPFLAYPLIGAIAYTFGGVATNETAEVLRNGLPIPGLYAAGEMTAHFHGTAPNAVSMLRSVVYGKIAGEEAVEFMRAREA
jgi:tricarballylate dehydrogenase